LKGFSFRAARRYARANNLSAISALLRGRLMPGEAARPRPTPGVRSISPQALSGERQRGSRRVDPKRLDAIPLVSGTLGQTFVVKALKALIDFGCRVQGTP